MVKIEKQGNLLLLVYEPGSSPTDWVQQKLLDDKSVTIKKVFTFTEEHHLADMDDAIDEPFRTYYFELGTLEKGGYYVINSTVFGLQFDLLLYQDLDVDLSTFVAKRNISVFGKIDALIDEQIIVGGPHEAAIPLTDFEILLHNFPTTTELNHYAASRITRVLKDYFDTMTDAEQRLEKYLAKRKSVSPRSKVDVLFQAEFEKYVYIRDTIHEMLLGIDEYSEHEWQNHMLDFLLLIFPKYVAVLKNVLVKDYYSKPGKSTNRFIDFALVNTNGGIDVIEIKKPFPNSLLSTSRYRDNYTPKKELSGAIVQAEKYLFHLNKWGVCGEKVLSRKYRHELPEDVRIRITNPKAIIIAGRDDDFDQDRSFDFEIIRRKYANIVDIITYDDLLRRLNNIIGQFENKDTSKSITT